mmetsp:Transcript_8403/g.20962  ORF Transcript_8403/g.20962 Transcript_8403/m.20962 type:complete len:271 (-) Transcript_8403:490-1302(-)
MVPLLLALLVPPPLHRVLVRRAGAGQLVRLRGLRVGAPEPLVLERVNGGDAALRVQLQALLQQLDSRVVDGRYLQLLRHVLDPLAQLVLGVAAARDGGPVGQLVHVLPRRGAGRAADLEDLVQLVRLVLAGEDGLAHQQLGKDGAHAPHVHLGPVLLRAQQQLGRAVPQRDDAVGEPRVLPLLVRARQPKVSQLHDALVVDQDVGSLEVAVQHALAVHVRQPLEQLLHDALDLRLAEAVAHRVHEPRQVVVRVVKHHVDGPLPVVVAVDF